VGKTYKYGVYGIGRIGKAHASIVQDQGHQIVAIGDDVQAAVVAAQDELNVGVVKTFHDPAHMAREMNGAIDAIIIASNTKNHAKDALPFVEAKIPIYLEKPLTDGLQEAFEFVAAIGRDPPASSMGQ
jgi:predicted dehydrogenase